MKPIIMSTEDVRVLLDGRKTTVRMPIRTPHGGALEVHADIAGVPRLCERCGDRCRGLTPPYEIGDVLWVRETWGDYGGCTSYYVYRADYPYGAKGYWHEKEHINWCDFPKWNSPVTMPREATRLFLRVKDVRVERVRDISNADRLAEGIRLIANSANDLLNDYKTAEMGREAFKARWDARNAKRGYGWDSNPWVWVIEFERTPSGAIGPEQDGTAPNGDKGATHE